MRSVSGIEIHPILVIMGREGNWKAPWRVGQSLDVAVGCSWSVVRRHQALEFFEPVLDNYNLGRCLVAGGGFEPPTLWL